MGYKGGENKKGVGEINGRGRKKKGKGKGWKRKKGEMEDAREVKNGEMGKGSKGKRG